MKRILKWGAIAFSILLLFLLVAGIWINKPLPKGVQGPEADKLAQAMLQAIDFPAWDTTGYIAWTFMGVHEYKWDRIRNWAEVSWKEYRVLINLDEVTGLAFEGGSQLTGSAADALVQKAWAYFCNDSFWLNAPAKVFDPGTSRALVPQDDGSNGLLITYESGGVTPGDSYLWFLDDNNRPTAWKMWVSIIPIGGIEFSWESWERLSTGAYIANLHKSALIDLDISNLIAASDVTAIFPAKDPFKMLENK
ncbi:MAG: hypothetical protein KDC34_12045 [Saprospiraceae bacterium]|nr:hypothetical protein [Saprospiraceae bacterium]